VDGRKALVALAALPKSAHPGTKRALAEIYNAEHWIHLRTTNPNPPSPPSGSGSGSPRDPAPAPPESRWPSSSSSPHRPGGAL
jgi:hypothetical protein